MPNEITSQLETPNKMLSAVADLLLLLIEKTDREYIKEAQLFVEQWESKGLMSYRIPDETFDKTINKLKDAGISYLAFDNATTTDHVIFFPKPFAQHVESIAIQTAKEADLLTQISKDEINDLCFGELMKGHDALRYEITVPDKLYANRLRENLTKANNLKTVFSMDENADGTFTFSCPSTECEKMNKAYFEIIWNFAGRFAELNRKQEEYDLERQIQLEEKMNSNDNYFIVEPQLDKNGNPTGDVLNYIKVSENSIEFFKNNCKYAAETIHRNTLEENTDVFQSWADGMSRPIIIDEAEWENRKQLIKERNPKSFLEQKDKEQYRAELCDMFKAEKKLVRIFSKPLSERSIDAINQYIENLDEQKLKRTANHIPRSKEIKQIFAKTQIEERFITEKDLSSLDRVIEVTKEMAKQQKTQAKDMNRGQER